MSSPAFQFYPERWLAATAHLTPAARGIQIDLLAWSWINARPLPRSREARCQIARLTSLDKFDALWEEIADKWTEGEAGFQCSRASARSARSSRGNGRRPAWGGCRRRPPRT